MTKINLDKNEKQAELEKYRDLVMVTLDYHLSANGMHIRTANFDSTDYYKRLKVHVEEHYQRGRLTILKQWFRDLTEMFVECGDLAFSKYLQDNTNYDVNIFQSYFDRIEKIINKGKITSDNQFYDINIIVDRLCQIEPVDSEKIEALNRLIRDYEERKLKRTKRLNA